MMGLTDTCFHTPRRLHKGILLDQAQSNMVSVKISLQSNLAGLHAVLPVWGNLIPELASCAPTRWMLTIMLSTHVQGCRCVLWCWRSEALGFRGSFMAGEARKKTKKTIGIKKKKMQRTLYFALNQTGCRIKRSRKKNIELKEPTHKQTNKASRAFQLDSLNKLFECRHAQTDLFALCPKYGFLYSPWNWRVFNLSNYYEWETRDSREHT